MKGKPKYKEGDIVRFLGENDEIIPGGIAIVDPYGSFFDDSDVCYDILVEDRNIFYKHVNEKRVKEKIGEKDWMEIMKQL